MFIILPVRLLFTVYRSISKHHSLSGAFQNKHLISLSFIFPFWAPLTLFYLPISSFHIEKRKEKTKDMSTRPPRRIKHRNIKDSPFYKIRHQFDELPLDPVVPFIQEKIRKY